MAKVTLWNSLISYVGTPITTSGGNIYCFAINTTRTSLLIKKSTDGGSSFSSLTDVTSNTINGGTSIYIRGLSVALDSAGYIHVVIPSDPTTRDVAYATLNTSNDSWSSWEQAANYTNNPSSYTSPELKICIDSSDKPHIFYINIVTNMGTDYERAYYTNKVSGSWLTPEAVSTATTTNYRILGMVVKASDVVEALYADMTTQKAIQRTRTSGSWGSETLWTGTNTYTAVGGQTILVTSGGTVYRYVRASDYYPYENDTSLSPTGYNIGATVSMYNDVRYLFWYSNSSYNIYYSKNSGSGWSSATTLQTYTASTTIVAEWAFRNEYQSNRINYMFYDGSDICFDYLSLGTSSSSSKSAYLKGTSFTNTNKSAYINGATSGAPSLHIKKFTGFEYGLSTPSINGGGLFDGMDGTPTIESTVKHSGNYSLHINPTATTQWVNWQAATLGSPTVEVGSVYIYVHTFPDTSADTSIVGASTNASSNFNINLNKNDHTLYGEIIGGAGAQGNSVVLSADTWYKIDYKFDLSQNPWTLDFKVNGVATTQCTKAVAASTFTTAYLGEIYGSTVDFYLDDWLLSTTADDYPLGDYNVIGLSPTTDGNYNNPNNALKDNDNNNVGTILVYDHLNKSPFSSSLGTYIKQTVVGSGNYAEVKFSYTNNSVVLGAITILQYQSSGTTANEGGCIVIDEDNTNTTVWGSPSSRADYSETSMYYKSAVLPTPAGGWDKDAVNALKTSIGYSNNVTSVPYWSGVLLEVLYKLDSSSKPAYIKGKSSITTSKATYINGTSGQQSANSNKPAYVKGRNSWVSNKSAYIRGRISITSNKASFVKGRNTTLASKPSYIKGRNSLIGNKSAYIKGTLAEVTNKASYIKGKSTSLASKYSYIKGKLISVTNKSAYTKGKDSTTSSKFTYIKGKNTGVASKFAFINGSSGQQSANSNKPAYIKGKDSLVSNKSSYIKGAVSGINSKSVYIKGKNSWVSNKSAYIKGYATGINSKTAYVKGKNSSVTSKFAYIKGKNSAVTNKTSYIVGKVNTLTSKSAYIIGTGQFLVPTSDIYTDSWQNELGGSVLYPSLADISDSNYAWYDNAVVGAYFEVKLAVPSTPGTGNYYLKWRAYKKSGAQSVTLKCELRQGATVIATDTETLTDVVMEYSYQLTQSEVSSITDVTDLRVRITIEAVN